MASSRTSTARFRVEADMLQPLANGASLLAKDALVMFEVASTAGIPDMVLLVLDDEVLDCRRETSPLLNAVEVRLMLGASRRPLPLAQTWSAEELAECSGVSAPHLRRNVLPKLESGGHLTQEGDGWALNYLYRTMAKRVITVEAKLRDWRGGIAQAARHTSVADAAWVALDRASAGIAIEHSDWFTKFGVGLLSASPDGEVKKHLRPGASRARQPGRELLVERAVDLHRSGKNSGVVPQVFGVTLTTSTGVDPRLEDAAAR